MSMLSTDQLNYMRDMLEELMPDTGNILSASYSSNGQGGMLETWGTATAGQKCRLDAIPLKGGEAAAGGAIQPFKSYILTLPYDATITEANRFEFGVYTFAVKSVDLAKSWAATRRAMLERE